MSKILFIIALIFSNHVFSQDIAVLLKEASNLERSLKENEAFDKYKEVLKQDPSQLKALVKCSELASGIGSRQSEKKSKIEWFDKAKEFAEKAYGVDSINVDAIYVNALVLGKYAEIETENKKLAPNLRDMKKYADKAVLFGSKNGKANYILGKWHYEMAVMPWARKAAIKVFIGGLPDGNIDSVYTHMEKCRLAEPYFVPNFFYLAKAYKFDDKPAKAIEVLSQLVKLPVRTSDDVNYKTEGKAMLESMQ